MTNTTNLVAVLVAVQKFYRERRLITRGKKFPATVEFIKDGTVFGKTNGGQDYQQNLAVL